jgi:hypothetical protein
VEEMQQSGVRIGQKEILSEESNINCRREEKNTTMEKITKQLRLRETRKRSATKINMVRGKLRSGDVSRVTYIDENGVVRESTGREHIEELCNKANKAKFQHTSDTTFMTGALQEDSSLRR